MADKYATCRQTMRGSGHASFAVLKNFRRAGHTCHTQITELLDFFRREIDNVKQSLGPRQFSIRASFSSFVRPTPPVQA